jgi:hypothetical protein
VRLVQKRRKSHQCREITMKHYTFTPHWSTFS